MEISDILNSFAVKFDLHVRISQTKTNSSGQDNTSFLISFFWFKLGIDNYTYILDYVIH